jgi:hypothetical protein
MWATDRDVAGGVLGPSRLAMADEAAQLNDAGHAQDGCEQDAADGGDQQRHGQRSLDVHPQESDGDDGPGVLGQEHDQTDRDESGDIVAQPVSAWSGSAPGR